jgi:hypothetical protein
MSKPKEFWLIKEGGKLPNAHTKRPRPFSDEDIHVIEYSAYSEALELLYECQVYLEDDDCYDGVFVDIVTRIDEFLKETK